MTGLIDAVMKSKDWNSTAIFLAWDDWGGFYDHVKPPKVDGAGLRDARARPGDQPVRASRGYIDHQTLSFDAYLKFIEDDFLGGQRLNPKTDGRPDPRPDVRENAQDPGQPGQGLRLQPEAAQAVPAAGATAEQAAEPTRSIIPNN